MSGYSKRLIIIFSLWAILFAAVIVLALVSLRRGSGTALTVSFLDVGQGDAIYVRAPNGADVLIDGGADTDVLSALSRVMPFFDRSIDIVLATHADKDHIGGLPAVLERFAVGTIMESGTVAETAIYDAWEAGVLNEGAGRILARAGMRVMLDPAREIYTDVLFPDQDVSSWEPNDGSIIAKLVYGERSFLLTGDAPSRIEAYLLFQKGADVTADVLKLGHHGSKTSSAEAFIEAVSPRYAIVSAECGNRYGHPHQDVVARVDAAGIERLGTCEKGTIVFKTDGNDLSVKFRK